MKQTLIIILFVQFVLIILLFTSSFMSKMEKDKAIEMAIRNEKEAIKQKKISKLYEERYKKTLARCLELENRIKSSLYKNQTKKLESLPIKSDKSKN